MPSILCAVVDAYNGSSDYADTKYVYFAIIQGKG